MELLIIIILPSDDKISYGKEGDNNDWSTEYHEFDSFVQQLIGKTNQIKWREIEHVN
jgi:hypothetical protein